MAWHDKSMEEVLRELETDAEQGISTHEASARRVKYGPNEPGKKAEREASVGSLAAAILPAVFLTVTAVLCLLIRYYIAAFVAFGAALVIVALKVWSLAEIRRVLSSVAGVTAPMTTVVRGGRPEIIETTKLVPGDLVQLRAGDIIGADMRLTESIGLVLDESILPGGFMGAPKDAAAESAEYDSLASHLNMCYTGTVVREGSGRAIVVAVGQDIAAPAAVRPPYEYEHRSMLNRTIAKQNRRAVIWGAVASAVIFLLSLLLRSVSLETLTGSALLTLAAAAALPTGFSITEAALSAASIRRLALRGTMVKSLDAMDRLASLDTILAQKTGAVASEEMTASVVWTGGRQYDVRGRGFAPDGRFLDADGSDVDPSRSRGLALTLIGGALCGDSDIEEVSGRWVCRGDPTEAALVTLAGKAGLSRADMLTMFPRVAEFPFSPERRRMTTFHKRGRQAVAYLKGAPEEVLSRCAYINFDGAAEPLSDEGREVLAEVLRRMTEQGLRVLAVAYREFPELPARFDADELEQEFILAGFVGIESRASHASVMAYNLCAASGIRTVLVTGDDADTAADLALSMGISGDAVQGGDLDSLPEEELREKVRASRVFARVRPEEKRAVVTALKHEGRTVAVTGTRASDAPVLMAADIGVSIGENASELTRDSADVVVEKAGYASLVRAIEESRRRIVALRSWCGYAFACLFSEFLTIAALLFLTPPVAFSMLHLVWLTVFLALIPAFVIGNEPGERDIMRRPPQKPSAFAYGRLTLVSSLLQALLPTLFAILAYVIAERRGAAAGLSGDALMTYAKTAGFLTITLSLLCLAYSARSEQTALMRLGIFSNRALVAVTLGVIFVLVGAVNIPAFQGAFATAQVGVTEWILALAAGLLTLVGSELYKSLLRPALARSIRERDAEDELPEGASLLDRLFVRFAKGDPTQEEELARVRKEAEEEAAAAEPAPEPAAQEEAAALPDGEPVGEEAAEDAEPLEGGEPESEGADAEEEPAADPLASLPEELLPYADILASLPPELLADGLPLPPAGEPAESEAEEPAEAAEPAEETAEQIEEAAEPEEGSEGPAGPEENIAESPAEPGEPAEGSEEPDEPAEETEALDEGSEGSVGEPVEADADGSAEAPAGLEEDSADTEEEPLEEPAEPADEADEPAEGTTEPEEELVEEPDGTDESTGGPAEPEEEPLEEFVEPADEADEPAEGTTEPEEEFVEEPAEPADEADKPAEGPAEQAEEPLEEPTEPAEPAAGLADEPDEPKDPPKAE